MTQRLIMRVTLPLALLLTVGCTTEGDGQDDSFGGKGAKSDGLYSECQLAEVIKFVNESGSTKEKLTEIGLSDDAASAIVAHRNGPVGQGGTGDDDIYDDLDELDKTDFVGQLALGKLVYSVVPRCEVDLANRPFIDDQTFTGTGGGWARDNEEVESVLGVQGITGQQLRALLLSTDSRGRTLYQRMRRNELMEAFTYGYNLDEIPWDADSQEARAQMPYVALTIESGRFDPDEEEGDRELTLGTDLMDDTYYDTHGLTLLGSEIQLRGRARWDTPTEVRRLLIAAKFGTTIDALGNKVNSKVDIRTDSGSTYLATLDEDVRRGKTDWSGNDAPATPIRGVYEQLAAANLLPTIGMNKGVLLLEPKAHLRSTRSRYHMNEASVDSVRNVYKNGLTRVQGALNVVERARAANIIPAGDRAAVDAMVALANGILDKSAFVAKANQMNPSLGLTTATIPTPDTWTQPSDKAGLDRNKVVAEAIDAVFAEFAQALDDTDRAITNAADEDFDDYVDMFRAWRVSVNKELAIKTTYDSFLASYRSLDTDANRENSRAAFNVFGTAQRAANNDDFEDFRSLSAADWARLGGYIEKAALTVAERQIQTAGIAARQLWFDQARELWVPASNRAFSNFMIDTTDMTDMLSHEEWTSIPEADRSFAKPLPAEKVFNTTFVNELQIELGMEKAYIDRLRELDAAVAADPNNAALQEQLEGARFVWAQYTGSMKVLTELKGQNILDRLRRAGAPSTIEWAAPADSKGNIALKILADRD